jgi:hypothetical protein
MVLSLFLRWSLKKMFSRLDKKTTGAHTETESTDFNFKVLQFFSPYNLGSLVCTPNYVVFKILVIVPDFGPHFSNLDVFKYIFVLFCQGQIPKSHIPTVMETSAHSVLAKGKQMKR